MTTNTPPEEEADDVLDRAFRQRRRQQLSGRTEPKDPASGTSLIAARLAEARTEDRRRPGRAEGVIDLTRHR